MIYAGVHSACHTTSTHANVSYWNNVFLTKYIKRYILINFHSRSNIQQSHRSHIDLHIKYVQQAQYQLTYFKRHIPNSNIWSNVQDLYLQVNLKEMIGTNSR